MARKNAALLYAQTVARGIVAEQTRVRLMMGFDAAIIAAHEVFQMGPGRAAAFAEAYNSAMEELATMYVDAGDGDRDMSYAKGKRDEIIRKIVGEENYVPFDQAYTAAYMDELRRFRVLTGADRENRAEDFIRPPPAVKQTDLDKRPGAGLF